MATNFDMLFSRRGALKAFASTAVTVCFPGCASLVADREPQSLPAADFLSAYGPINRTLGEKTPRQFSGDSFERPHRILWDIPGYLASHAFSAEEEVVPLVVVGGGASGLFTAYNLREFQPVVLEQAARLGGNAKGESWRGLDYALGSAYIDRPYPGTAMHRYYQELGWKNIVTERISADPVEGDGKVYSDFWAGEAEPAEKKKYARLSSFFQKLDSGETGVFPSIPALTEGELKAVKEFDQWDLHTLLSRKAGGKLPPRLETALEHFCWSTYAASAKELSSAAALNFLAQERTPICVAPGGNAGLLEPLLEKLLGVMPSTNLRTECVVLQVKVEGDGVRVLYEDSQRKLRAIRAKSVVMACPKFVVAKILVGAEPERLKSISKLKYRAYVTANLLVNQATSSNFYDLFLTGKGKTDPDHSEGVSENQNAT